MCALLGVALPLALTGSPSLLHCVSTVGCGQCMTDGCGSFNTSQLSVENYPSDAVRCSHQAGRPAWPQHSTAQPQHSTAQHSHSHSHSTATATARGNRQQSGDGLATAKQQDARQHPREGGVGFSGDRDQNLPHIWPQRVHWAIGNLVHAVQHLRAVASAN